MTTIKDTVDKVISEIEKVIFGKRNVLQMVMVCLLAEGHLLMEDVPGTAKTLLAKALARTFGGNFKRLQCTPDLLPSDVTGVNIFNQQTQKFEFHAGPVWTRILLADEINRATPRAQAALLECMAERQLSVENKTYALERPFFVIATQNPVEHEGTFALPEAQLDRFLMRISMGYPALPAEDMMLQQIELGESLEIVKQVITLEQLLKLQDMIRKIHVHPSIREYIIQLVSCTRNNSEFFLGASPRASKGIFRASQAMAAISGREYVIPDDIKAIYPGILYHRVILSTEGRINKQSVKQAVDKAVNRVPVPLLQAGALVIERSLT